MKYQPSLVPSLWYPLPSYLPSSISVVSEDSSCSFIFCFFGVDVAGGSDWIPPFICISNSWPFPLWMEEIAAHWSGSPGSFSSWSSAKPFLASISPLPVLRGSSSWSDPNTQGEGVRRSSAVSHDVMECWLSSMYPLPLRSSILPLRSKSARARVTWSPLLLMSRKQLAESITLTDGESSAWQGPEPPRPANFSQKPEEDLRNEF